jgi:iron complex outermembrane receptor protein
MRYEHFSINDDSDGKPVFRAGANYQVAEETYIRSSFGQGFRFPTIAEKYIRTGLGDLQVYPNENLKPESSTSLELAVKQGIKIGEFLGYVDVAVFQQRYTDFIEFTFGTWAESQGIDNLFGLGFRSLNTGESQVRGAEVSLMGQAKWGSDDQHSLDILTGYTYTNPISLTPEFNYGDGVTTTYLGTSYDTTGHILKYRSPHLVRFDAQWTHPKGFLGVSARYQSVLQNFDKAFVTFEDLEFVDWGLNDWLENHPTLPWIIDLRVGFNMSDHSRISLVVSNLLNEEYSIRPLAIESPRLVNFVYTYEFE